MGNLYNIMMNPFKGKGLCVTMDSACMGDIMALIGRHEWLINMVGTANENRNGANTKEKKKEMKKGDYESILFHHNDKPLCYAMCLDNNIVHTLSNFHPTKILQNGLLRKRRVGGVRERHQTSVSCPEQNRD